MRGSKQQITYSATIQFPDEAKKQWDQMAPPPDEGAILPGKTKQIQKGFLSTALCRQGAGNNILTAHDKGSGQV